MSGAAGLGRLIGVRRFGRVLLEDLCIDAYYMFRSLSFSV